MQYPTPRITQPGWWKKYLWLPLSLILILLLVVYFGWRNYYQEWGLKVLQVIPLQAKLKKAQQKIKTLEADNLSRQGKIAALVRQNRLELTAMKQTQASLQQRQLACLQMEEELAFLKHMVSPDKPNNGLRVQKISLQPAATAQEFLYRFTITQGLNKAGNATGWIRLFVEGESGGEKLLLNLQEITEEKIEKIKMHFQHFQDVAGTLRLPQGFIPKKMTIEIKPGNKSLSPLKKSLDWVVTE